MTGPPEARGPGAADTATRARIDQPLASAIDRVDPDACRSQAAALLEHSRRQKADRRRCREPRRRFHRLVRKGRLGDFPWLASPTPPSTPTPARTAGSRGNERAHDERRARGPAATGPATRESPQSRGATAIGRTHRRLQKPDGPGVLLQPRRGLGESDGGGRSRGQEVSGTIVTARCRELGIPDRFAPSLSLCWHGRGYDNSVDRRKSELLGMAKSKIAALEAKAIVEIGIECSRGADRNRIGRPDERRGAGFIAKLTPLETLMPKLSFEAVAGKAKPPVAEQLVSSNALRQRRFRERHRTEQVTSRNGHGVTPADGGKRDERAPDRHPP